MLINVSKCCVTRQEPVGNMSINNSAVINIFTQKLRNRVIHILCTSYLGSYKQSYALRTQCV